MEFCLRISGIMIICCVLYRGFRWKWKY